MWCEFDSGVPEQKEGPVIWPIFLPSLNVAPLPNKWQPLSLGTSFAQKEKKLHSGWDSHRAWQASTEVSTGQRAPRKLSSGTYFTFPLMQLSCPAFLQKEMKSRYFKALDEYILDYIIFLMIIFDRSKWSEWLGSLGWSGWSGTDGHGGELCRSLNNWSLSKAVWCAVM